MSVMATNSPKKPKGGKADPPKPRPGRNINVWVRADLGDLIQAHMEQDRPQPTLTALIEAALEAYFRGHPLCGKEGGGR